MSFEAPNLIFFHILRTMIAAMAIKISYQCLLTYELTDNVASIILRYLIKILCSEKPIAHKANYVLERIDIRRSIANDRRYEEYQTKYDRAREYYRRWVKDLRRRRG